MSRDKPKSTGRRALDDALGVVAEFDRRGWVCVPARPSAAMTEAGADAGGITPEAAARVYAAMVKAV